ncbi:hypothetical protein DOTSEDRAFT_74370 [Dothistroma septosporum NZE10]|uniref:Vegetative cell wall protein gp1 n=1 Tax=Dothistroma septosporum (strain NZE10 / CBS 128990) TaxID=675120 RepID=N1PFB0_DOTSN|nr:hypothetical protein DOTSEDRAFT_74370 [Dothistroma septosporum NZE10]
MATYQTYGAPPGYASYHYRSPPQTPPPSGAYAYYSPRNYSSYNTKPGHTRRATGDGTTFTYAYTTATPRKQSYSTTPEPTYNTSAQATPQRTSDYVSGSDRKRENTRTYRVSAESTKQRKSSTSKQHSSRPQYVDPYYNHDRSYEYLPRYETYEPHAAPPPYKQRQQSHHYARADHRSRDQVPIYTTTDSTKTSARPRRASYTTKSTNPPPRPSTATKSPPAQATADDARRAGIPAGYSYKNWDPAEEPILLLGSVFDANSLGKWIYDWTVFFYGPATPMSEVAGEMWLLLIQLAHKVKRAEEIMPRIRATASRDLVDDFLDSGERLWQRFNKLLKICENYMWKAAKKESGSAKKVTMGKNSGCEFVDSIFGRDRELDRTEKLMTGMRLWSMRFDANCEGILRNPAA